MNIAALGLPVLLAVLIGFAIHRSGVCTVKAVMEVVTTGRAFMLASFWRAMLWVMLVDLVVYWAGGAAPLSAAAVRLSVWPLVGGMVFGMGAAMNRGCAFSSLNGLGGGDLGMAVSIAGFFLGAVAAVVWPVAAMAGPVDLVPGLVMRRQDVAALATLGLAIWAIRQAWRLWQGRPRELGPGRLFLSERYRLSTGAAVMGLAAGGLYALEGPWVYTATLQSLAGSVSGAAALPSFDRLVLFLAVFLGVVLSVWQRRAFRLRVPDPLTGLRHFAGGMMMGAGAAMIPGGNDVLVLQAMPLLMPHAFLAFLGVLGGIWMVMIAMKLVRQDLERLDCSGDVCRDD